ncbi:mechanosensitive ion channel [Novosphingobium sp. YJ-S2-02]|uniref:Mechanosensitive ion channel n=1 Tax=Novosphingobium aureum TaxID=2792964 RepID=A0A931HAP5_9SPHN|nr:mechanosensitive ion channel family protein [Novosphingobium aureum]MBH0112500.1 mechanosensitive ion channel [Novosphingobium aureum]
MFDKPRPKTCTHALATWLTILCGVLWVGCALVPLDPAHAAASASAVPGSETEAAEQEAAPSDPYGRETPRGVVSGLVNALAAGNYGEAAAYFEASVQPQGSAGDDSSSDVDEAARGEIARQLQQALDAGGSLESYAVLSSDPAGTLDDGLPPDAERVGKLRGSEGAEPTPILLTRGTGKDGARIWRISRETSDAVAAQLAESGTATGAARDNGPEIAGASIQDWLTLFGLGLAIYLAFQLATSALLFLIGRMLDKGRDHPAFRFAKAAMPPLSLFVAIVVFQVWADSLPVSIVARQLVLRYISLVALAALTWFLLRLVDALGALVITRMEQRGQRQVVSVVTLLRRAAKLLLLFAALVAFLDTFGIDVTTGIAALGIGGIALALGAQKTVENLVGSVSLVADKPFQVGDFCKVGDVIGTIEDIGIRSTRVRTLTRTLVTIPNGDLSQRQIENYALRDRFLFNPVIGVEYGIGSAKLLEAVERIEGVLSDHERIAKPGFRARFVSFGASSLDIEIFSYIEAADYDESLVIQQDLLLLIFARLEEAGIGIAFPTRTLHLVREKADREQGERLMVAQQDTGQG